MAHPMLDHDILIDALPSGAISNMHEITKRLVAAMFGKECPHVYSSYMRDFLLGVTQEARVTEKEHQGGAEDGMVRPRGRD